MAALRLGLLLLVAGLACACASPGPTALQRAQDDYDAGRWQSAYDEAMRAQAATDGEQAARAAYLAGLSAFRMERWDDAERRLRRASTSGDPTLAGRARAQLGAVRLKQGRPADAAEEFRKAAELLEGEEAARARYQAALALRDAGDPSAARSQMLIASDSSIGRVRDQARAELPQMGWTLQGGCFRDKGNADRFARQLSTMTIARGYGPARAVAQTDGGQGRVYCVFVGEFATRQGAEEARERLGRKDFFARTNAGSP